MEWLTFLLSNGESMVLILTHAAALLSRSPLAKKE